LTRIGNHTWSFIKTPAVIAHEGMTTETETASAEPLEFAHDQGAVRAKGQAYET